MDTVISATLDLYENRRWREDFNDCSEVFSILLCERPQR